MSLTALRPTELHISTNSRAAAARAVRRGEIEEMLAGDEAITREVAVALAAREQQDRFVDAVDADPAQLAELGDDGYLDALKKRTSSRMTLGRALLKQAEYRRQYDIPALRAECAAIDEADAQDARAAHAGKIDAKFVELLGDMRTAAATYEEIVALFDEAAARWPNNLPEILRGYSILPPGLLSPNGKRSIPVYLGEMIAITNPAALPPDDPARLRIEAAKAAGEKVMVWSPALIWG